MLSLYLGCFLVAGLTATCLTWLVRNTAFARGWVSGPQSERHLHNTRIPRLGGVAIAATVFVVTAFVILISRLEHLDLEFSGKTLSLVLGASLVSFVIGLRDDLAGVRPWAKIAGLSVAGLLLYVGHVRVVYITTLFGSRHFGEVTSLLLTLGWVVFIANAFNLIDGLDGLAAGSALFSTTAVFVVAMVKGSTMTALLTATLAGAILGFLRYNFNPATIFMGDCGSLFIGCLLSSVTLTGLQQQKSSTLVAVAIPVVAFGLPILETGVSVVRRILAGQPIFNADRRHIHHRLLDRGWSQRQAVVVLYAVSALFGLMSLLLLSPGMAPVAVVLVIIGTGIVVGVQQLGYHEFFELGRIARRTLEQRQIIVNNLVIRRGIENLARCRTITDVVEKLEETFRANDFDAFTLTLDRGKGRAELTHSWVQTPSSEAAPEQCATPAFTLGIPLRAANGQSNGELVMLRYRATPIVIDIEFLTSEFATALSRACEGALRAEAILVMPSRRMVPATAAEPVLQA
ncbi:MAG: MraY family glycosyltransferase [Candidatus Korobacteraceae bacterium]